MLGVPSTFRGVKLLDQLNEIGLTPIVEFGHDSRDPKIASELESFRDAESSYKLIGRQLSHGEIACYLGHQAIYRKFLESDSLYLLVLEDDTQILDEVAFEDEISRFVRQKAARRPKGKQFLPAACVPFLNRPLFLLLTKLLSGNIPYYSTCCYILNRKAVQKLVEPGIQRVCTPADWPIQAHRIDWQLASSDLVKFNLGESLISKERQSIWSEMSERNSGLTTRRLVFLISRLAGVQSILLLRRGLNFRDTYTWYTYWRLVYRIRYRLNGR